MPHGRGADHHVAEAVLPANGARLATVVIAILLTIFKDRIWRPLPIEPANVAELDGAQEKLAATSVATRS